MTEDKDDAGRGMLVDEDVSEETRVTAKVVVGTYLWRGNIGRHRNHRLAPKKSLAGR